MCRNTPFSTLGLPGSDAIKTASFDIPVYIIVSLVIGIILILIIASIVYKKCHQKQEPIVEREEVTVDEPIELGSQKFNRDLNGN